MQGHEVISIHHCVDDTVQDNRNVDIAIVTNIQVQPVELFDRKKVGVE